MAEQSHHTILIVGGGTGGIASAALLRKMLHKTDIALIEPATKHYYQPGWTMVGGGIIKKEITERDMATLIPPGVTWIQERVTAFQPKDNRVALQSGATVAYDYLVVAAGAEVNWGGVKGLPETLGRNGVCSIYDYQCAETTWTMISEFKGGNAIFTQPKPPFKCPGAAQKIAYLADDTFRNNGVRERTDVRFRSAAPGIFPVKKYAATLTQVIARRGIDAKFQHNLIEVRADAREAVFENLQSGAHEVLPYDLLHVTPPNRAPQFVRESPLADAAGWMNVDKHTLRQIDHANIFGLGDVTNTPNSKTAAAIRRQVTVLAANLLKAMAQGEGSGHYDGYAACPLITGYGKLVLAEFNYDMEPQETFPFDQSKERLSMYWFKRYVLPKFYWDGLLKGHPLEFIG